MQHNSGDLMSCQSAQFVLGESKYLCRPGVWSDALPTLVLDQWRGAREGLLNLSTPTAAAAVQAWLVDTQAQVPA